jgi:hypothetical protein
MLSSSFPWVAALSRFWVFWIRNTIRNVAIVVLVLITCCHVSLKPNTGPMTAQATSTSTAIPNVDDLPALQATRDAK